ncbi:MAG: hypothetical protein EBR02_03030 [Alphaproteobacteria bacterium]|nr:hypothetical protein [Alphaproteobacteria bacterium]
MAAGQIKLGRNSINDEIRKMAEALGIPVDQALAAANAVQPAAQAMNEQIPAGAKAFDTGEIVKNFPKGKEIMVDENEDKITRNSVAKLEEQDVLVVSKYYDIAGLVTNTENQLVVSSFTANGAVEIQTSNFDKGTVDSISFEKGDKFPSQVTTTAPIDDTHQKISGFKQENNREVVFFIIKPTEDAKDNRQPIALEIEFKDGKPATAKQFTAESPTGLVITKDEDLKPLFDEAKKFRATKIAERDQAIDSRLEQEAILGKAAAAAGILLGKATEKAPPAPPKKGAQK